MSKADDIFINTCRLILDSGTSTINQKVRPRWEDGTSAYTVKKFGIVNRYDLREEFPAITLRKTAIKSAMDEILWIYQRKSNNINDLNSHIWDSWADSSGSIGKAYGYQVGKQFIHHTQDCSEKVQDYLNGMAGVDAYDLSNRIIHDQKCDYLPSVRGQYEVRDLSYSCYMDQMDGVLYDLKHTPFSRRIMISLWDINDLHEMGLQPCCWSVNFNVTDEGCDKLVLNMVLNQRSSDVLTANNWNVVQYAILLMMVAQVSDMIPGELIHVITDAHIYDRHIPIVKELIQRDKNPAPIITLNPDIKDFYQFTTDDLKITNYTYNTFDYKIPVAV